MDNLFGIVYCLIGIYTGFMVYRYLENKNQDGDPEGLDFFTSIAAGCFWPLFLFLGIFHKLKNM